MSRPQQTTDTDPVHDAPLLDVRNLRSYFRTRRGLVKAVDGASFSVKRGEALGLVGESGTATRGPALSILGLLPKPSAQIAGGEIKFDGEELVTKSEREVARLRGKFIAMVLQDPMSSLNPVLTIGDQVSETLVQHNHLTKRAAWVEAAKILAHVQIPSPEKRLHQYSHEMSGGMRQRIATAIGISCNPKLLIADEPTTALDVTIQAQILDLLQRLRAELNIAIILITHDLSVVATICDRIAVMYAGRVVESGPTQAVFSQPKHPYTAALINSLPHIDERLGRLYSIPGQPPDMAKPPSGCRFAQRCPAAMEICRTDYPPETVAEGTHSVSCWLHEERTAS